MKPIQNLRHHRGEMLSKIKDHSSSFSLTHFPAERIIILADQIIILFVVDANRESELTSAHCAVCEQDCQMVPVLTLHGILARGLRVSVDRTHRISVPAAMLGAVLALAISVFSQTTISTGAIQGTVTDPSGALVSGANVSLTNMATGQIASVNTNSAGAYTFAFLKPGDFVVTIEAKDFKTTRLSLMVKVDQTANGSAKLVIGDSSESVDVLASDLQVNTVQATVQGVLTTGQIANLPVNGRNFLDLAQLEPGVQIQDGQNVDPTKGGYFSISFGGRFGRTARIEVDGADVSDETVGTTTTDIPFSAIQEFQISQSSLDMSTELTSSGSVNVTTKSGTNNFHGEAFGQFRDSSLGAAFPTPPGINAPYQRSQYGAALGGPIIKDRLFFFLDGERNIQHAAAPVPVSDSFLSIFRHFF